MKRFDDKWSPDPNTGCWLWTAQIDGDGYGIFWLNGKNRKAHRVSYGLDRIPDGLEIDHLCRVRCCVNPAHLEPVNRQTNAARSPILKNLKIGIGQKWTRGERQGRATLDNVSAAVIRSVGRLRVFEQKQLAKWFGVTQQVVQAIVAGRTWKAEWAP